jgi:L-ascorbate metabolism protein UlaG (beta-lactamase superfamily)
MKEPVKHGAALLEEMDLLSAFQPRLWWLGQSGFAIKYFDTVFYVDPVLTAEAAPLSPAQVTNADMVLCTNPDARHMDIPTLLGILQASPRARVVLPKSAAESAQAAGIGFHRMTTTDADLRIEYFKNGCYKRVYAIPSARPELDWTAMGGYPYLGYLVRCGSMTVYHAGACAPYEGLADRLRPYNVTVAIVPVGASESATFTVEGAAQLAADIGADWLVPMYGAEPGETPQRFLDHMLFHRPSQRFKVFREGEGWQIPLADEQ